MWAYIIVLGTPFVFGVLLTLVVVNWRHNAPSRQLEREIRDIQRIGTTGRRQVSAIARELEALSQSSNERERW